MWLPVLGFEGYFEVSDLGEVRSIDRRVPCRDGSLRFYRGHAYSLQVNPRNGYMQVKLSRDNKIYTRYVHHLVLEAFVGPRPDGHEALHGDDDKSNNALTNLRWGTSSENKQQVVARGHHNMMQLSPELLAAVRVTDL